MAELVRVGKTTPWIEERGGCVAASCIGGDDIRGNEYSEVTYSSQRPMAGDKNKLAVGLSDTLVCRGNHYTQLCGITGHSMSPITLIVCLL